MRNFHFRRLPGTKVEVEAIHQQLSEADLYTDKDALEETLLQAESPRILHLATHGFFLEDQDLLAFAPDPLRGTVVSLGSHDGFAETPMTPFPAGQFKNPLLRSGIALAGANTAAGSDGHAQGIVAAEKILGTESARHGTGGALCLRYRLRATCRPEKACLGCAGRLRRPGPKVW